MRSLCRNERGMTLFTVLFAVVVIGLMLGLAGQTWSSLMQREREEELYFRGDQYRRAIQAYYEANTNVKMYPTDLKQLMADPRFLDKKRYLRKLWSDPITGEEWELITEAPNKIKGVRSRSTLKPFKEDGFPEEYQKFVNAENYSKWEFVFEPQAASGTTTTPPPKAKQ